MTFESLLAALRDTDVMLPLACSVAAGALIGMEREIQRKPAGLRTHTLVCFASALMTLLGLRTSEWIVGLPEGAQVVTDLARMPHAILTGIGFLGAGVIFREGVSVQGLTTAASLWLTAALGIVFGAGMLELGLVGTVIALIVLVLLRAFQRLTPSKPMARLEIVARPTDGFDSTGLNSLLARLGLRTSVVAIRHETDTDLRTYTVLLTAKASGLDVEKVAELLAGGTRVQSFAIIPVENDLGSG